MANFRSSILDPRPSAIPVTAYLALGSNIGDREVSICAALKALAATPGIKLVLCSTLLENAAVGGPPDSPDFLNAVAQIHTTLSAQELLHRLLEIEQTLGRERREKWAPRTIDLDILLYGDAIIATEELTIPHPLMHTRRFVLEPLAEIAPLAVHPVLRTTVADLARKVHHGGTESTEKSE